MNPSRPLIVRVMAPAALAACLLGLASPALAQNSDAPKPSDRAAAPTDDAKATDADRDALRERLARQLEFTREREQKLDAALKLLDEGKPLSEVRDAAALERGEIADRIRDRMDDGSRGDRVRGRGLQDGQGPRTDRDRPPLGPEDLPRLMEFIERHNPELAKDLHELAEKDPDAFRAKLAELAPRIESIQSRFEERPERFQTMLKFREIDQRAHRLARAIADDPPNAADLALQLRQAVSESFELRVQLGEQELQDLQKRIEGLEKRAQKWSENEDSMIDGRVKELIEGAKSGEPPPRPGDEFRDDFPRERGQRRGRPDGPPPGERERRSD